MIFDLRSYNIKNKIIPQSEVHSLLPLPPVHRQKFVTNVEKDVLASIILLQQEGLMAYILNGVSG